MDGLAKCYGLMRGRCVAVAARVQILCVCLTVGLFAGDGHTSVGIASKVGVPVTARDNDALNLGRELGWGSGVAEVDWGADGGLRRTMEMGGSMSRGRKQAV